MKIEEQPTEFTIILKKIMGVLLIIFGIFGLFLPFIPGIAMIIAGIILLGNKKLSDKVNHFYSLLKKKLFGA